MKRVGLLGQPARWGLQDLGGCHMVNLEDRPARVDVLVCEPERSALARIGTSRLVVVLPDLRPGWTAHLLCACADLVLCTSHGLKNNLVYHFGLSAERVLVRDLPLTSTELVAIVDQLELMAKRRSGSRLRALVARL